MKLFTGFLLFSVSFCICPQNANSYSSITSVAGSRASRILSSYPKNTFPTANYWINTTSAISNKFIGSTPAVVWVVGLYTSSQGGGVKLNFPSSDSNTYNNISFGNEDLNDSYLNAFDNAGVKVWLQVEPGYADIDTLIGLVLNRYKHHKCVQGVGVDIEWREYSELEYAGKRVTDEEAQRWEEKVKAIDTSFTLFLKHFKMYWMPPTYRGEILFINDSQDFAWSINPFKRFLIDLREWGKRFYPAKVLYQFGYETDSSWYNKLSDPLKTIGDSLFLTIPNCFGVFWVDFTIDNIYPVSVREVKNEIPSQFLLNQNYPNPFNPSTFIDYTITENEYVTLKVYDLLGNVISTIVNDEQSPGYYKVRFAADPLELSSGIYFYQLQSGKKIITKKMLLIK